MTRIRQRFALLLTALAVMGSVVMGVRLRLHYRQVARLAAREVTADRLSRINGRMCESASGQAYTGWVVESYPDGSPRSRSQMRDGLLEGISQGWHTNGTLQVTEHFVVGVSHGQRTKWYENGVKESEARVQHGRLEGDFLRWNTDGTLIERIALKDGRAEGVAETYNADGSVRSRVLMAAGRVVNRTLFQNGGTNPVRPAGKHAL